MPQRRTNLWIRKLEPILDGTSKQDMTCKHQNCIRVATHVIGWENPHWKRYRYGASLRCAEHAKDWHEQHASEIQQPLTPGLY